MKKNILSWKFFSIPEKKSGNEPCAKGSKDNFRGTYCRNILLLFLVITLVKARASAQTLITDEGDDEAGSAAIVMRSEFAPNDVYVTYSKGFATNTSMTSIEPTTLSASAASKNILCHGGTTTVIVAANGGTSPYTGTGNFSETAGTYTYVVSDANGYSANVAITITEPPVLSASSLSGNIFCHGGRTAVIVTANGGTNPYEGTGIFPEPAGTYTYTVSDANGCISTSTITLTEPDELVSSVSSPIVAGGYNITSNGATNGSVNLDVSGGTTAYAYGWSNGAATQNIAGVGAGTYSVRIRDANGCSSTSTITLTQPDVSKTQTDVSKKVFK